jgi:hypothetical protein
VVRYLSFFAIFFVFCSACRWQKRAATPAFYYWKQDFSWSKQDSLKADSFQLKKMYVKFFDVKKTVNGQVLPVSTLENIEKVPSYLTIIPVVYIQNEVFELENPDVLAKKIHIRLCDMLKNKECTSVEEIQIDCDWTATTREAYFKFLKKFKTLLSASTKLSATIRLHQIKYAQKTGIPPVDKGLLMYYNMGDIKNITTENSILDNKEGAKYLDRRHKYPLPLDFALPIFEWSVLYQKNQFSAIFSNINTLNINSLDFLKVEKKNNYVCVKDTLWNGIYLRPGDKIRHEFVQKEDLDLAAKICADVSNNPNPIIIFFHWEKNNLQQYENNFFQKTLSRFE